jgi:hypothetical protein
MKWILIIGTLLPLSLCADPVTCPSTTFDAYLTVGTCTVAGYTISNFTFSSTANAGFTAYTASEFEASPDDDYFAPLNSVYFGVEFIGAPSAPAGAVIKTYIDFDIASTDSADTIGAVALSLNATAGSGGAVTLADYGSGDGQPFFLAVNQANPLAEQVFNPFISGLSSNAVLVTDGPDTINNFRIKITDFSDVPEPAAWSLMGIGLLMMSAKVYRRKRRD